MILAEPALFIWDETNVDAANVKFASVDSGFDHNERPPFSCNSIVTPQSSGFGGRAETAALYSPSCNILANHTLHQENFVEKLS